MGIAEKLVQALGPDTKTIETAVSWVFLTEDAAYKLKKPVAISGLLDYSTAEKRRKCAEDELKLNSEICPELYDGMIDAGVLAPEAEGEVLLKMKRIPDGCVLSEKVGSLSEDRVAELACIIAAFHENARIDKRHGRLEKVREIWRDHKSGMASFNYEHDDIFAWADAFMDRNAELFAKRVKEGRSRDCHGDFHSGNVFLHDGRLLVFDRIDFNESLRCSDVASEVAFMAMDLEFHGRADLSRKFVDTYVEKSGDETLRKLLPFYKCHRAYVRGKIATWAGEREKAEKYFELARSFTV